MDQTTPREEYRVCRSRTTGFYYFARFLGDLVHPDHPPMFDAPHSDFISAYRVAKSLAEKSGLPLANKPVDFTIWPDIYRPVPKPKAAKKPRERKKK